MNRMSISILLTGALVAGTVFAAEARPVLFSEDWSGTMDLL